MKWLWNKRYFKPCPLRPGAVEYVVYRIPGQIIKPIRSATSNFGLYRIPWPHGQRNNNNNNNNNNIFGHGGNRPGKLTRIYPRSHVRNPHLLIKNNRSKLTVKCFQVRFARVDHLPGTWIELLQNVLKHTRNSRFIRTLELIGKYVCCAQS